MKRQNIISKLMNEGFSQKTLVNLSDKQLHMLAERVLSEQYVTTSYGTTTNAPGVTNVSRNDTNTMSALKQQRKPFVTYENEVKEQEKLGTEKKKEPTEKESTLKKIFHKMENKMKKDECIKSEIELLQRMKEDIPEKYKKYVEKRTKKEPEPVSENKKIKKWVDNIVENKCITSKNEIVNLIKSKLTEQWKEDEDILTLDKPVEPLPSISQKKISGPQPETKPVTKPETRPETKPGKPEPGKKPWSPFKPQPGPSHAPKMELPDFLKYDTIVASVSAEPSTKPETKPETRPETKPGKPEPGKKPWNPFKPQPGPSHAPKMKIDENKLKNIIKKNLREMAMDFDTPDRPHPDYPEQLRTGNTPFKKVPFPETGREEQNFQEILASERYKDIVQKVREYTGLGDDTTIQNSMYPLIMMIQLANTEIMNSESGHEDELAELAVNLVIKQMGVPEGSMQFDAKIVKPDLTGVRREREQEGEEIDLRAEADLAGELDDLGMERAKRRIVNALSQGGAAKGQYLFYYVIPELTQITGNENIGQLYGTIMSINDTFYWQLGTKTISSEAESSAGGKVEVDRNTEPPTIKAEGLNFPILVHELVKGVMELLSYHSEPSADDPEAMARYQAATVFEDTLEKELWDLRLGPSIWNRVRSQFPEEVLTDENKYELQNWIFGSIFKLPARDFLVLMMKVVNQTDEGKRLINDIYQSIVAIINNENVDNATKAFEDDIENISQDVSDYDIDSFIKSLKETEKEKPEEVGGEELTDKKLSELGLNALNFELNKAIDTENWELAQRIQRMIDRKQS